MRGVALRDALERVLHDRRGGAHGVYCASGPCRNSGIAANRLVAPGYTHVADYHEGKAEWIEAGLPVEGASRAAA